MPCFGVYGGACVPTFEGVVRGRGRGFVCPGVRVCLQADISIVLAPAASNSLLAFRSLGLDHIAFRVLCAGLEFSSALYPQGPALLACRSAGEIVVAGRG